MCEWKSIDQAPRDGSRVLLASNTEPVQVMPCMWEWDAEQGMWIDYADELNWREDPELGPTHFMVVDPPA